MDTAFDSELSVMSIKQEHNLQENSGAMIDTSGASFSSTKQCQLGLFITFSPSLAFLSGMKVFFGIPLTPFHQANRAFILAAKSDYASCGAYALSPGRLVTGNDAPVQLSHQK